MGTTSACLGEREQLLGIPQHFQIKPTTPHTTMKFVPLLVFFALCAFVAPPVAAQSVECEFCEFAVKYIEGWLAENATEQEIEKYLDLICVVAPSDYKAACISFINNELPLVIAYIENNVRVLGLLEVKIQKICVNVQVPPQYVCSLVGLCPSSLGKKPIDSRPQKIAMLLRKLAKK
jgi:hypothetical protein